jgi:hypothetical protein
MRNEDAYDNALDTTSCAESDLLSVHMKTFLSECQWPIHGAFNPPR